jgi:hypothetical protein
MNDDQAASCTDLASIPPAVHFTEKRRKARLAGRSVRDGRAGLQRVAKDMHAASCSRHNRSRLVFTQHADNAALDPHVAGWHNNGRYLRVCGLQTNLSARLAIEPLHRGFVLADERHDNFT